jgi:hypothetical protein
MSALSNDRPTAASFVTEDEAAHRALLERAKAVGIDHPDDVDPEFVRTWGPAGLEGLVESLEDLAAGRVTRYHSDEEFLASLERGGASDRNANLRTD